MSEKEKKEKEMETATQSVDSNSKSDEEVSKEDISSENTVKENDSSDSSSKEDAANDESKEEAKSSEEAKSGEEEAKADEESEADNKEDDKKKKGFFKKDKKDPRDEKIEELNDRVKRQMAEFENFRKRTEKEKSSMYEMGATAVVEKILPIIDNFERGLAAVPEGTDSSFVDGMKMIYKQLVDELEKIGVKPIEALGKEFDPNFHNAVMQVESEEYESGFVAQELQKGYMYHETVVRYSMVAVVQ